MLAGNNAIASKEYQGRCVRARRHMRARGWSVRRAALYLERNYVHLQLVISGQRLSEPLIARVLDLPRSPVRYTRAGFALKFAA